MDDYSDRHKDIREERPEKLGFKEIVPGQGNIDAHETGEPLSEEIPEFDLGQQMMAQHRKATAGRRKGPSKQSQTPETLHAQAESTPAKSSRHWTVYTKKEQMDIIAEIVTRDIERLRSGESVFV